MAKYSRFDPSNKKKSRDKNSVFSEKNKISKAKKVQRDIEVDWGDYEDKYDLQKIVKNLK